MAPEPNTRGTSETMGVAVLIVITLVATASVGLTVTLLEDDQGPFGAEFIFDYSSDLEQLLIFYDQGEPLPAGNIHIIGPAGEVTWAELDGVDPDTMVEPRRVPVRLSENNAYGAKVEAEQFVEIRYVPDEDEEDAEEVVLATWNEGQGNEDGDIVDVPEE